MMTVPSPVLKSSETWMRLEPLGDRAFLAFFDVEDQAARWAEAVRREGGPGVVDVVLAYRSVGVHADPDRIDLDELESRLWRVRPAPEAETAGRLVTLPVLYDGEDLAEVCDRLGLSEPELIARHVGTEYRVFAIGFLPGFPYAGYLPEPLCGLARRAPPRHRVPAGSVAIAGRQTGIYPVESPGGWHLIGRSPVRIVDLDRGAFPIRAGDRLRFVAITLGEFEDRLGEMLERPQSEEGRA